MKLFAARKELGVQTFILKLVNNNCSELQSLIEGPRLEHRVSLTVPVLIIPIEHGQPALDRVFPAVTKEIATAGLSVVLDEPRAPDEVVLAVRWQTDIYFVKAKAVHLNPMGAGFYQLGFRLLEMVHPADFPDLRSVQF